MTFSSAGKLDLAQGNQISRRHSVRKHYLICLRSLDGQAVKRQHEFLWFHLMLARLILAVCSLWLSAAENYDPGHELQ